MLVHKLTEPAKQGDAATVRGENPVDACSAIWHMQHPSGWADDVMS